MFNARHPLQLVLGLTVWAVWFSVLYGGMSVACAVSPPAASLGPFNLLNGALLLFTLLTAGLIFFWSWRCWKVSRSVEQSPPTEKQRRSSPAQQRFITRVAAAAHLAAGGSVIVIGLPILALPPCL